jgi:hypothetical protein
MQRISQSRSLSDRRNGSLHRKRRPSAACSNRPIAAFGVATLAPVFTQALPELGAVPTAYSHEFRAELLYDLCAALVREGLGGPATWRKCEESAQVFAQRAIIESIGEKRWNLLQRNVEYHLSVTDICWWPSRSTTQLSHVSTKRASTCWRGVQSRGNAR